MAATLCVCGLCFHAFLRKVVRCRDTSGVVGDVSSFDLPFDQLVVAVGSRTSTFNVGTCIMISVCPIGTPTWWGCSGALIRGRVWLLVWR